MDDIIGCIQNEQVVTDKTKPGPELSLDGGGICSCELGVRAPGEDHARSLEILFYHETAEVRYLEILALLRSGFMIKNAVKPQ
jgi:hypothetical protein